MPQRVLQGLKEQGQVLAVGFEYLMNIRPLMMEAQVHRRWEGPSRIKKWRPCRDRGVPRRRLVHRLFVALEWIDSQACVSGRLMWNLSSFSVRRVSRFLGLETRIFIWWTR